MLIPSTHLEDSKLSEPDNIELAIIGDCTVPPEIPHVALEVIAHKKEDLSFFRQEQLQEFVEEHKLEFLGSGSDKFVLGHPDHPERVYSFTWLSVTPEILETRYWNQQIMSTIFPQHFPRAYGARIQPAANSDLQYGIMISERIDGIDLETSNYNTERQEKIITRNFKQVQTWIENYQVPVSLDLGHRNFLLATQREEKGELYYMDHVEGRRGKWDATLIREHMEANNFSLEDITTVETAISHLQDIDK